MRIISGKHKGRVLKSFKGDDIRPTSDRAKEALFNILGSKVYNAKFLDLFSGTGSMGIEAISRGAEKVIFVDGSKDSVNLIKGNLALVKEDATVILGYAESFLNSVNGKFDIIFLDPPYNYRDADGLFKIIKNRNLLNEGGIIVYEHNADYTFETENFEIYDNRKYGIAVFDFLRSF